MNKPTRYILLVLGLVLSFHWILSFTHKEYGRATSISTITQKLTGAPPESPQYNDYYSPPPPSNTSTTPPAGTRENATFVILARNTDIDGTIRSIRDVEDRFNHAYHYPFVFLNEEPFTDEFKSRISNIVSGEIEFGQVPHGHWFQPSWIDEDKAEKSRKKMEEDRIIYGGSVSYRNMCRFNSGFFFKNPLLLKYRYYWRIEPDVHFHCDILYDPFKRMREQDKVYGFTIAMYEYEATIPTLWGHVKDFISLHPEHIAEDNAMGFMSDDGGESYNKCHFWSNFEIADLDFWRGEAYTDFFEYLDSKGGFYYERWGDAPVHSIAAALFLPRTKIQFFNEIGYEHNPYTHCPQGADVWKMGRCACNPERSFDYDGYSCMRQWDRLTQS